MPTEHLPYSGFQNIQPATPNEDPSAVGGKGGTNSLSAFRIHEKDPVLFSKSFSFNWIASSDNAKKNAGFCNYDWPAAVQPDRPPEPFAPGGGGGACYAANGECTISVDALAFLYIWPEDDAP